MTFFAKVHTPASCAYVGDDTVFRSVGTQIGPTSPEVLVVYIGAPTCAVYEEPRESKILGPHGR